MDKSELLERLRARLKAELDEREQTLAELRELSKEIESAYQSNTADRSASSRKELGIRSSAQAEQELRELELERSTTSVSLAREKEMIKRIAKLKGLLSVMEVENNNASATRDNVNALKEERTALKAKLDANSTSVAKLKEAVRKMEIYEKTGAKPEELVTVTLVIPLESVGNVIGKQGSIVNKLQDEHKVVLEIDSLIGEIKIQGREEGVTSCKDAVEAIANTIEKKFSLKGKSALARALMMEKAERLRAIETEACVTLRMERNGDNKQSGIRIRGEQTKIESAISILNQLDDQADVLDLSQEVLRAVIGKKGSTLEEIQSSSGATVIVQGEKEDKCGTVSIFGTADERKAAVAAVRKIQVENTTVVTVYKIEPSALFLYLMGPGAGRIMHIQSKAKARIDAKGYKEDEPTFTIKANKEGTAIALEMIAEYKKRWLAERKELTLTSAEAKYLIGRRGERINALKDRFGDESSDSGPAIAFSINIDDKKKSATLVMRVLARKEMDDESATPAASTTTETASTAKDDSDEKEKEIAEDNIADGDGVEVAEDGIHAKAKEASEVQESKRKARARLVDHEQDARNAEEGARRIHEAHAAVKELLSVFRSAWVAKRELRDDEVRALIGKGGATINKIISETGAEVDVGGKKGEPSPIVIRGTPDQQKAARDMVRKLLYEHHRGTASLQIPANFVGAVIGKGGSNLAKISEETETKIELKRGKDFSTLYIRGSPESIDKAVAVLAKYATHVPADLELAAQKAADLDVEDGLHALLGQRGSTVYEETVELAGGRRATQCVVGSNGATKASLEDEFGVVIRVDSRSDGNGTVTVRGAQKNVVKCMEGIAELVDAKVRAREEVAVHPRAIALLSGASFWPQRCLKDIADCDLRFNKIGKASRQAPQRSAKTAGGSRRFGRGGSVAARVSSSASRGKGSSTLEAKFRVKVTVTGRSKTVVTVVEMLRSISDRCKAHADVERIYVLSKHIQALKRGGMRQMERIGLKVGADIILYEELGIILIVPSASSFFGVDSNAQAEIIGMIKVYFAESFSITSIPRSLLRDFIGKGGSNMKRLRALANGAAEEGKEEKEGEDDEGEADVEGAGKLEAEGQDEGEGGKDGEAASAGEQANGTKEQGERKLKSKKTAVPLANDVVIDLDSESKLSTDNVILLVCSNDPKIALVIGQKAREIVSELSRGVLNVSVPVSALPSIIGRKGATIKELRAMGAEINISEKRSSETATVTVRGQEQEKVVAIVERIKDIAGMLDDEDDAKATHVHLLPPEVGAVIGSNGAAIKAFRKKHPGCRIDIDGDDLVVRIAPVRRKGGTSGAKKEEEGEAKEIEAQEVEVNPVLAAKEDLISMLQREGESKWTIQRLAKVGNDGIPFTQIASAIVGRGGEGVRKIELESGCQVNVIRSAEKVVLRAQTEEQLTRGEAAVKISAAQAAHDVDGGRRRKERGGRGRGGGGGGGGAHSRGGDRERDRDRVRTEEVAEEPEEDEEEQQPGETTNSTHVPGISVQMSKNARRRAAKKARKKVESFKRAEEIAETEAALADLGFGGSLDSSTPKTSVSIAKESAVAVAQQNTVVDELAALGFGGEEEEEEEEEEDEGEGGAWTSGGGYSLMF